MLLSTVFFISRYKILIQSIRPSQISPCTTRTISTLIALFHKLPINMAFHSTVSEFSFQLLVIHIYLTMCLQDEEKHDNAKACVHDSHSPGYFCHMTKYIYVRLSNETVCKHPNLRDFSFVCLVPPFVVKMTVSVMFVPRAAVAVSAAIMTQRTPDAIRGGPTL
jgi:hypothetical protein